MASLHGVCLLLQLRGGPQTQDTGAWVEDLPSQHLGAAKPHAVPATKQPHAALKFGLCGLRGCANGKPQTCNQKRPPSTGFASACYRLGRNPTRLCSWPTGTLTRRGTGEAGRDLGQRVPPARAAGQGLLCLLLLLQALTLPGLLTDGRV